MSDAPSDVVTFRCPECNMLRAYSKRLLAHARAGFLQWTCAPPCEVVHTIHADGTRTHT